MSATLSTTRKWFKIIAPCAVVLLGVMSASHYLESKPKTRARKGQPVTRLVDVQAVSTLSTRPVINVNGQVSAQRIISLRSQQRGEVVQLPEQNIPGGHVRQGDLLLQIDPRDYQLNIQREKAGVTKSRARLEEEKGRQRVARVEYELSGAQLSEQDQALVLRQPQLAEAEADLEQAEASLAKAMLEHQQTRIAAPFSGQISQRHVNIGSMVQSNMDLFDLVATDAFWLEISLPTQYLQWIDFPKSGRTSDAGECTGSAVHVRNVADWPANVYRDACIVSLLPNLHDEVRTATVLAEIKDPMSLLPESQGKPPVLINEFLQAEIQGNLAENVVRLPRRLLQNGNRVWLMNSENRLESREVSLAYRGRDHVLVDGGLQPGERLVTTSLPGAIAGIALRTESVSSRKDNIAQSEAPSPVIEQPL